MGKYGMTKAGMFLYCLFVACCVYVYTFVLKPTFNIDDFELTPVDNGVELVDKTIKNQN